MLPSWLYACDRRCDMHIIQLNTGKLEHVRIYSNVRALCRISFQFPRSPGNKSHSQKCIVSHWQLDKAAHFRHLSLELSQCMACDLCIVKYTLL